MVPALATQRPTLRFAPQARRCADDLAPARGLIVGAGLGIVCWATILALLLWLLGE